MYITTLNRAFLEPQQYQENSSPHSGKALSISPASQQTLRSSRGPYYEFIFTLGSWSFIVPRFPIPLVLSACFTNTATFTSAAAFAIGHRTSSTSPAPPTSQHGRLR